jgi:uncharacterized protein with von Willebrand factor type A (vWA) domain
MTDQGKLIHFDWIPDPRKILHGAQQVGDDERAGIDVMLLLGFDLYYFATEIFCKETIVRNI